MFGWRTALNRLPTLDALKRKNGNLTLGICPVCEDGFEYVNRLFSACSSFGVWLGVSAWYHLPPVLAFAVRDILSYNESLKVSKNHRRMVQSVMLLACWAIWRAMSNLVFN
ncbi:hypothetical protein HanRHA438_Chr13g0597621 [Helianthus annuus]|nr:hypothetical protein HanRHA438_Chr13g0597621 [Helianthus annuus]